MIVKLRTEHHLEFLSLKGGCRGSSESTLVKMSNCWKSHALAHYSQATYQRLLGECLGDLNMKICVIYLDDLINFSDSFEQHMERLDRVLTRLSKCNLKLAADKCFSVRNL